MLVFRVSSYGYKVARRRNGQFVEKTCFYWKAGRCNRNPCRFLHSETTLPSTASQNVSTDYCNGRKRHSSFESEDTLPKRNVRSGLNRKSGDIIPSECVNTLSELNVRAALNRKSGDTVDRPHVAEATSTQNSSPILCKYWIDGNCVRGDQCRYIHSWFYGDRLATLTKLEGHKKRVSGIKLSVGSDKLFSSSTDGTLRTWDCHTGQCANVMNLGAEVTSLISEGQWIFVGLSNTVKAWNIQTGTQYTLDGPKGKVLSMFAINDTLLAGAEDGVIYAWRVSSEANSPFKLVASLRGHTKAVVCLAIGRQKLYSGSMDKSIKVWDLDTFECSRTLNGHTDVVTSLICWDNYLLSGSLDSTIKIWYMTQERTLEVTYTHTVEAGVVALSGMTDAEGQHILLCSTRANSVHLYELPSFAERGKLFARREVGSIEIGPGGLIITGDQTGLVTVSKWLEVPKAAASS